MSSPIDLRTERGQATAEVLMLSWVVMLLLAAGFQLYLANRTIFRTLTAGHYMVMTSAFAQNCSQDSPRCTWSREKATAILGPVTGVPEADLPRLTLFGVDTLPPRLYTASPDSTAAGEDDCTDRPDLPCHRIKAGAGTYQGIFTAVGEIEFNFDARLLEALIEYGVSRIISDALGDIFSL